jgi:hypothetical protein
LGRNDGVFPWNGASPRRKGVPFRLNDALLKRNEGVFLRDGASLRRKGAPFRLNDALLKRNDGVFLRAGTSPGQGGTFRPVDRAVPASRADPHITQRSSTYGHSPSFSFRSSTSARSGAP